MRDGAAEEIDPWLLSPTTAPLVNVDTWETHLLLGRRWLERHYLDDALARIASVLPSDAPLNGPPAACDEGGSVERTGFENRTSEYVRVYRACRTAGGSIDGTITERFGGTSDGRGRFNESVVTFEDLRVALDDGRSTTIEIDARIERTSRGTTFPCFKDDERWASTVRAVERSERGMLAVDSADAVREQRNEGGSDAPSPGGGRGATCVASGTTTTTSARATVVPPHAPDAVLSVAYESAGGAGSTDATLSVRASDGSSVTTTGALDGSRVQQTLWGGDGAVRSSSRCVACVPI